DKVAHEAAQMYSRGQEEWRAWRSEVLRMIGARSFHQHNFVEARSAMVEACDILERQILGRSAGEPLSVGPDPASLARMREVATANTDYLEMKYLVARSYFRTGPPGKTMDGRVRPSIL